jgi:hypothetical protein
MYLENKQQNPLSELMMSNGKQTVEEWLMTQPEEWRDLEIEAIYECLKRGWKLHIRHIQMIAREIDAKRNPKGW